MTSPAPMMVMEMVGVSRSYGSGTTAVAAIVDATVSVSAGDRIAVVGPSGSGKTTLLSLMGLIEAPDTGEVRLFGSATEARTEDERAELRRTHVGLVFQTFHLIPALSALDNVLIPVLPYEPRAQTEPRARDLLARIGLGGRAHHRPAELSGGEQQRVAIARALINEPHLVLADEPTGNLDSQTGQHVIDLLREFQEDLGFALVVATHDTDVAGRLDRTIRLSDGRIV